MKNNKEKVSKIQEYFIMICPSYMVFTSIPYFQRVLFVASTKGQSYGKDVTMVVEPQPRWKW